jgi:C_GCAxxG_C_C family probable redox protein
MSKAEQAKAFMLEHRLNCSQSVVSVFCEDYKLDRNVGIKICMGFGGGMARTGRTCGAVTGVYMVIGLSQHVNENNPRESIERTYKLIHEFNRRFKELRGALDCKDLIKYDLGNSEQYVLARDHHVFTRACPDIVRDAAEILESILTTY